METIDFCLNEFPGRESQVELLYNLFAQPDERFVRTLFIYGGPSTGKTAIVNFLMKKIQVKYVYINLVECYTSKVLYEMLLNKFSGHKMDPHTGEPYAKCDNMMDFLKHLKNIHDNNSLNGSVLVLDKAERLRNMEFNILPAFLRFEEISGLSISTILISEIIFEKFYHKTGLLEPIKIHFPQYNERQLIEILTKDIHFARHLLMEKYDEVIEFDEEFYRNYIQVFISVFYQVCRDLSELRYMARINFLQYCQPIISGEAKTGDSMILWRKISSHLKDALKVLYLRTYNTDNQISRTTYVNPAQNLELPFYAKYLLIAAYLASYNPVKDDKRMFVKFHGKKRKTKADIKAKSKTSEQLNTQMGPKAFTLDRLLAIFYAILGENIGFSNNLLVQLSSLVQLQLLTSDRKSVV